MIFKSISRGIRGIFRSVRKVVGWLLPSQDQPDVQAVLLEKQGSDHPIPYAPGTRRYGGIKVHKYVTDASGGAKNEFLHLIVVFCEGPVHAIEEVFFNGISEHDAQWEKEGGGKWFSISRHLGAHDQSASPTAVLGIPNWTTNHRLQGVAYIYVRLQMDEEQSVWRGEPEITARVAGRTIYDPRTGLTGYSENPAIQLLDYLTNPIYGKGLPNHRLNLQSFITSADLADEEIDSTAIINGVSTGIRHKRFTGNHVLDTSQSVFENTKQMVGVLRGMLPIGSGRIRLQPEDAGEPVFFFSHDRSDADNHATIVSPIKSASGKKSGRYNRVVVRFPNKDADYESDEVFYPADGNSLKQLWLAEDNGVLLEQSFEYKGITNKAEALQMAEIIAKRSRNNMSCSFTASPLAIRCEPGDIVGVTDDTRGWNSKPFRIENTKIKEDGDVDIELIEHQNAVYPWSGTTYEERIGGTNLGDPTAIQAPTGLTLTADTTLSTGGRLTWSSENNAFIRRWRVAIYSGTEKLFSEETAARSMTLPLFAAGEYTIRVYSVSTLGTLSPPANLLFELLEPVPPTDLGLSASNNSVTAEPFLLGAGLGTVFECDIVLESEAAGFEPVPRLRGGSAIFTGRIPNTEYRVFVRTVNALGVSAWVSEVVRTTLDVAEQAPIVQRLLEESSVFDDVVESLSDRSQASRQRVADARPGIIEEVGKTLAIHQESERRRSSIIEVTQAIQNEARRITQLNVTFDDFEGEVTQQLEVIIDPETGIIASAITEAAARFDDEVEALSGILNDVLVDPAGNSDALAALYAGVTGETGTAQAVAKLQAIQQDGGLIARGYFGTELQLDGSVRLTGMVVQDDGDLRVIEFAADRSRWVKPDGSFAIVFAPQIGEYIFDGRITARSLEAGSVTADKLSATAIDGKIFRGVTMVLADSSLPHMSVYGTGFGDTNQFIEWYGPRNSTTFNASTGYPRFTNLTYANATYFRDVNGDYSKDVRRERNETSGTSVSVTHLSEGSMNQVSATFEVSGSFFQFVPGGQPRPDPMTGVANLSISIFRGNTKIATRQVPVQWWWEVVASGEEQTLQISGVGSVEAFDTQSAGSVTYRAERGQVNLGISQFNISYKLAIQTFEVKS